MRMKVYKALIIKHVSGLSDCLFISTLQNLYPRDKASVQKKSQKLIFTMVYFIGHYLLKLKYEILVTKC